MIAGAAALAAYQYYQHRVEERRAEEQAALQSAASGNTSSETPTVVREVPPPGVPVGENAIPQPRQPQPKTTPAPRAVKLDSLSPADRAAVEMALRSWNFTQAPTRQKLEGLTPADSELLAEWQIRRTLLEHAATLEPALPARLQRIDLANGNTMWGTSALRNGERWDVQLLTGIKTSLPTQRVRSVTAQPRDSYLVATKERYEEDLADLQKGGAGDIVSAFALAQRRGDRSRYDSLLAAWKKADGPTRLATVLPEAPRQPYTEALATLHPTSPTEVATRETVRRQPGTTARPAPVIVRAPRNLAELNKSLSKIRVSRRLSSKDRDHIFEQLLVWDEWLDKQVQGGTADMDRINSLRHRIGVIRLDLAKTGGFGD